MECKYSQLVSTLNPPVMVQLWQKLNFVFWLNSKSNSNGSSGSCLPLTCSGTAADRYSRLKELGRTKERNWKSRGMRSLQTRSLK